MAKITEHPKIDLVLRFEVSYSEAAALDALAGYGDSLDLLTEVCI